MMATARADVAEEAEAEGNMASGPEAAASTEEDEGSVTLLITCIDT